MKKDFPPPLILAGVATGLISIPFHGLAQTMIITVCAIATAMYARQSGLNERKVIR